MKFEIKRAKNGILLSVHFTDGEFEELVYQEVEENEVEAFANFLRVLDEHYGPSTSRYSPKRIYVRMEPGDKFE